MFNNYLYLKRHVDEIANILKGQNLFEAFTQEKDQILFKILGDKDYPDKHLVFSTKANSPIFYIKNEHKKAKKNVISFFTNFLPAKIIGVQFCKSDRILKITLSTCNLYFFYSGPNSNVIICSIDRIESFKKSEFENLQKKCILFNKLEFYSNNDDLIINNYKEFFENKTFSILSELLFKNYNDFTETKRQVITQIMNNDISVYWNSSLNKISFLPLNINLSYKKHERIFTNVNDAIIYYLSLSFKTKKISILIQSITRFIDKELERLSEKLNNLRKRISEGNKEYLYRYFGNLILTNLYNYKKIDDETITVFCYENNKEINIKIKKDIDIKKNIDYFFDKATNEKLSFQKSIELLEKYSKKFDELLVYKKYNYDELSIDELEQIIKELKINMKTNKDSSNEEKYNFRVYLIAGKYKLFVGKDSTNNDLLTTRFAKQNDFWFHVRGTSGSHAVLRIENTKEVILKNILKIAASITAYHSKAKTAGIVPVVYTLKKYVIKRKGMNVGQVALLKEDVLLVKPEIPAECEYISDTD
ncbi:MAG TPA: NFACT RNA binding domain-containing protein [Melioribacteraceae bacterium]|nr:NFACT RNA binding domain-containing protein [Melioribacteraceae bacterium]